MKDLHVASSASTAGSLKHAITLGLLQGDVFYTAGQLTAGPLHSGSARMAFLREMTPYDHGGWEGATGWDSEDAFGIWDHLWERVQTGAYDRVLIWAGGSGNDYIFLRLACYRLKGLSTLLMHIPVPPRSGCYDTAVNPPEVLAPMIITAIPLTGTMREQLAAEFETIAAHTALLRECDSNGVLVYRALSAHDDLLLAACSTSWQLAARVIGTAMGNSDPRNSLGDGFLIYRLEYLINSGRLEADGPRTSMRSFSVRLAAAGS